MRLLSRISGGEAVKRPGMEHTRHRKPLRGQLQAKNPSISAGLTTALSRVSPEAEHALSEQPQTIEIPGAGTGLMVLSADMREAQEVEGLRLAFSSAFPVLFRDLAAKEKGSASAAPPIRFPFWYYLMRRHVARVARHRCRSLKPITFDGAAIYAISASRSYSVARPHHSCRVRTWPMSSLGSAGLGCSAMDACG